MEQMILRAAALGIALALAAPLAAAQEVSISTYRSSLALPPGAAAGQLNEALGGVMEIREERGVLYMDYAGFDTPDPLRRFLLMTFEDAPKAAFGPGVPVNVSLAFLPEGTGTEARLMVNAPQFAGNRASLPGFGTALPEGATVLTDGTSGDCAGQAILSQPGLPDLVAPAYVARLTTAGFDVTDASDADTSFFVGYRPGCSLFLYLQPDPAGHDRSTVVLNYVEE